MAKTVKSFTLEEVIGFLVAREGGLAGGVCGGERIKLSDGFSGDLDVDEDTYLFEVILKDE